jgi:hypothetical protein
MVMVEEQRTSRGIRRRVTAPSGQTYLGQVARSGFVEWSYLFPQSALGWAVHECSTWLANRLIYRGGWTVVVWQSDDIAPKRKVVVKRRFGTYSAAVAALEELAWTIERSGPPPA